MRKSIVALAFVSAANPLLAAEENRPAVNAGPEIPAAFIAKGALYYAARDLSIKHENSFHPILIRKVDLRKPTQEAKPETYRIYRYNKLAEPLCWRIAHDCLWLSIKTGALRIPLDELILFDRWDDKAKALNKARYPKFPTMVNAHDFSFWDPFVPLWSQWEKEERYKQLGPFGAYDHFQGPRPMKHVYSDFLPVAPDSVRLFVLTRDRFSGVFDSWEGRGTWFKEQESWKMKWPEKPTEQFKSYFHDPFAVYAKASLYLFMTPSGKYYLSEDPVERDKLLASGHFLSPRNPDKGKRNAHPHWKAYYGQTSEDHPARAVIVDVDAGETYVFLRPYKDHLGRTVEAYFALSPNPKVESCHVMFVPDDPMRMLVRYTEFLIDMKKIRLK
jgi:hypothetical protein